MVYPAVQFKLWKRKGKDQRGVSTPDGRRGAKGHKRQFYCRIQINRGGVHYFRLKKAKPKASYYNKYTGKSTSIVDALKSLKVDSSFKHRQKIAKANGIKNYVGTPKQNLKMLDMLKKGILKVA